MEALVMPARKGQPAFPFLVSLPPDLVGTTFGHLFEKWISSGADCSIPLGLYRALNQTDGEGPALGYVFGRCPPGTVLLETDKVYVLAPPVWGKRINGSSSQLSQGEEQPLWRTQLYEEMSVAALNGIAGATMNGPTVHQGNENRAGYKMSKETMAHAANGGAMDAGVVWPNTPKDELIDRRLSTLEAEMQNVVATLGKFDKKLDKMLMKHDEDVTLQRALSSRPRKCNNVIPSCRDFADLKTIDGKQ
jgi:hypothetical protein